MAQKISLIRRTGAAMRRCLNREEEEKGARRKEKAHWLAFEESAALMAFVQLK